MNFGGETRTQFSVQGDISTLKPYDSYFVYPPKSLVFTVLEAVQEVATVLLSCRTDHRPRVNRPKGQCCCNARDRDLSYHGQRLGPGMTLTCPGIWKIPPLRFLCMPLSAVELKELCSYLSSSTPRTSWASAVRVCRTTAISKLTVLKTTLCLLTSYNTFFSCVPEQLGSGAVGWGAALQAGRWQVRFSIMSLEFFIEINLPAALWLCSRLSL